MTQTYQKINQHKVNQYKRMNTYKNIRADNEALGDRLEKIKAMCWYDVQDIYNNFEGVRL